MTERELMAAKYQNTAFAILYVPRSVPKQLTEKELADKARKKAQNDIHNAMRKANNISADNKQKANWTI